jgi:hypothetical protein
MLKTVIAKNGLKCPEKDKKHLQILEDIYYGTRRVFNVTHSDLYYKVES